MVPDVVVHEEDEGQAYLLHPSGRYFGLNATGVVVWRALEAGRNPVEALGEHWPEVAADVRRRDVEALVDRLIDAGLLEPGGDG